MCVAGLETLLPRTHLVAHQKRASRSWVESARQRGFGSALQGRALAASFAGLWRGRLC